VADSSSTRRKIRLPEKGHREEGNTKEPDNNSSRRRRRAETNYWSVEPNVGRVANGIPKRVDRLKGLGNAIVPQVAALIMERIKNA
jgi:DNA (cytosine-5)-methyltransferase 1